MRAQGEKVCCSPYLHSPLKRLFDVAVSVLVTVPAVLVIAWAGVVILLIEGRPVFFVQRRVGRNGRLFSMPKLRTLNHGTEPYQPWARCKHKKVVTRTGAFLRRHRLDELPQIYNVLLGQMSLVGPRPELPTLAEQYTNRQRIRLLARPGLTGLWQLMADHDTAMKEGLEYDIYYIRHASFSLDVKILLATVLYILNPQ